MRHLFLSRRPPRFGTGRGAFVRDDDGIGAGRVGLGSLVCAVKPGDGSAREQAASSQKMLGGQSNVAREYATKRYRSNLVNWGMIPWIAGDADRAKFKIGAWLFIPRVKVFVSGDDTKIEAQLIDGETRLPVTLSLPDVTRAERNILIAGCLVNAYRSEKK